MIAVGGRHERERQRGFEMLLELPDLLPVPEILPKTLLQGPVYRPRRAKNLESGQSEPARFVLYEDLPDSQSASELRSVNQWRLLVARQPAVESQGCPIWVRPIEHLPGVRIDESPDAHVLFEESGRGITPSSSRARRIPDRLQALARRLL